MFPWACATCSVLRNTFSTRHMHLPVTVMQYASTWEWQIWKSTSLTAWPCTFNSNPEESNVHRETDKTYHRGQTPCDTHCDNLREIRWSEMSNIPWTVGLRGLRGLIGCFHTYLILSFNTPWGAQAVMAHRGVKTKLGQWQCGVQGSVFPHLTHLTQLWQGLPHFLGGLQIVRWL